MRHPGPSNLNNSATGAEGKAREAANRPMNAMDGHTEDRMQSQLATGEMLHILAYLEECENERETTIELSAPNPIFRMAMHLIKGHLEAKITTPTSLIAASNVPYATANRRLKEMIDDLLLLLVPPP